MQKVGNNRNAVSVCESINCDRDVTLSDKYVKGHCACQHRDLTAAIESDFSACEPRKFMSRLLVVSLTFCHFSLVDVDIID